MTDPDPFEILEGHVPFSANSSSDPDAAKKKAAMYQEILMSTTTLDRTTSAFTPRESTPSQTRIGATGRRMAVAVAAIVCAVIGATLIPFGENSNIAVAAEAAAQTAEAESGSVSVVFSRTGPDGEPTSEESFFVFDGDDAFYSDQFGPRAITADGVGYINQQEWIASELFDRERLFFPFADNLATTEGLAGLLELSDESAVTTRADGTEVVTATIRVDAGPGQAFDIAGFDNLPAGLSVYPEGNFDLNVTVDIVDGFITELAWTATGTRHEPTPGQAEGEPSPADSRPFRESGVITYSGINEPQTIEAPAAFILAEGLDEWKLLDGVTRTTMQTLYASNALNPGVCGVDTVDVNLLIKPLTPANTKVFETMTACFDEAGDTSAARGIETLIEHRR